MNSRRNPGQKSIRLFSRPQRRKSGRNGGVASAVDMKQHLEQLEDRRLMTADFNDQASEALDYGQLSGEVQKIEAAVNWDKDVDVVKFQMVSGQRLTAAVVGMGYFEPRLRLFGPKSASLRQRSPVPLVSAANNGSPGSSIVTGTASLEYTARYSGTYYLGVSAEDNYRYNIVSGGGDRRGRGVSADVATGDYHLYFTDADLNSTEADLSAAGISAQTNRDGQSVDVAFDITNNGDRDAESFDVAIYASTNSYISSLDTLLTTVRVYGIGAGQTFHSGNLNVALPSDFTIPDTGMHIGIVVDSGSEVSESDEYNNSNTGVDTDSAVIVKLSRPDLQGGSFNVLADRLAPGQSTEVHFQVANTGETASGKFSVTVYASNNLWISEYDTALGTVPVDSIPAGGFSDLLSATVRLPDEFDALDEAFSIGIVIDSLDEVDEENEYNNDNMAVGVDWDLVDPAAPVVIVCPAVELDPITQILPGDAGFSWTGLSNADYYELWVIDLSSNRKVVHRTDLTASSFSIDGLLTSGSYRYWVRAGNSAGWGPWSIGADVRVGQSVPQQIVLDGLLDSGELSWQVDSAAVRYELWVNDASSKRTVLHRTDLTTSKLDVTSTLTAGSYQCWVRAGNDAGWGDWSSPVTVTVGSKSVDPGETTIISPEDTDDPTSTVVWQDMPDATHYELWVSERSTGKKIIHQKDVQTNSFTSATELDYGEYTVWVKTWNGNVAGKWSSGHSFTLHRPLSVDPNGENNTADTATWLGTKYATGTLEAFADDLVTSSDTIDQFKFELARPDLFSTHRYKYRFTLNVVEGDANDLEVFAPNGDEISVDNLIRNGSMITVTGEGQFSRVVEGTTVTRGLQVRLAAGSDSTVRYSLNLLAEPTERQTNNRA